MNSSEQLCPAPARTVCCDVAAHACVQAPSEAMAELRRRPGPVWGEGLPASFLKHADEQTVVGLTAVYQAIQDHGLTPAVGTNPFADWGVLAAPRFLGRPTLVGALQRFATEGAWGVSPHLIPHRSLHSISGTVSLALKSRGPNFGVGGGPGAAAEALLAAASLLGCRRAPGIWVVLTAMHPEEPPDENGRTVPGTHYAGLALALLPAEPGAGRLRLCIASGEEPSQRAMPAGAGGLDLFRLQTLLSLVQEKRSPSTLVQMLDDAPGVGSRMELIRGTVATQRHGRIRERVSGLNGHGLATAPLTCDAAAPPAEGHR